MTEEMVCQYLVQNFDIKRIEGKLLALVESLGVPTSQESAIKSLVRQFLWEPFNDPNTPIAWEADYHEVWEFFEKLRKSRIGGTTKSK